MDNINYLNTLTDKIIGAAIEVHRELGPGLLESVYEACLVKELKMRGLKAEPQIDLPIIYKGVTLEKSFRIDVVVEDEIILELKAVDELRTVHEVQLMTYMKLANKRIGLLMNFNVPVMKNGIKRKING